MLFSRHHPCQVPSVLSISDPGETLQSFLPPSHATSLVQATVISVKLAFERGATLKGTWNLNITHLTRASQVPVLNDEARSSLSLNPATGFPLYSESSPRTLAWPTQLPVGQPCSYDWPPSPPATLASFQPLREEGSLPETPVSFPSPLMYMSLPRSLPWWSHG